MAGIKDHLIEIEAKLEAGVDAVKSSVDAVKTATDGVAAEVAALKQSLIDAGSISTADADTIFAPLQSKIDLVNSAVGAVGTELNTINPPPGQ